MAKNDNNDNKNIKNDDFSTFEMENSSTNLSTKKSGKNLKALIGGAIAVAVLVGGLIFANNLDVIFPKDNANSDENSDSTSSAAASESIELYAYQKSEVEKVSIQNEHGNFSVEVKERIKPEGEDAQEAITYVTPEYADFEQNQSSLSGIITSSYSILAQKIIEENPQDLAPYGLDSPRAVADITFTGGDKKTVKIGNDTPTSSQVYIQVGGDNTVYTAYSSSVSSMFGNPLDFISLTLTTASDIDPQSGAPIYPIVDSMEISRGDWQYDYKIEAQDLELAAEKQVSAMADQYMFVQPVNVPVHPDRGLSMVNGVFGLTGLKVEAAHPATEELALYGLDDPFVTVKYNTEGESHIFKIGNNAENSSRYIMFDDNNLVMTMLTEKLPWATMRENQIFSSLISSTYIFDLAKLEIKLPDTSKSMTFELSGQEFAEEDEEKVKVLRNGEEMVLDYFKKFYQYVLSAPAEEIWPLAPIEGNETALASIKYTTTKGYEKEISFYQSTDRMIIISLNGQYSFRCRQSYLDRLFSNMELLESGGEILMSY